MKINHQIIFKYIEELGLILGGLGLIYFGIKYRNKEMWGWGIGLIVIGRII